MTGILIVTHAQLGDTLIDTLEFILGKPQDHLEAISIDINQDPDNLRKKIKDGIKKVRTDEGGILILTDMFGGTPSNLSYSFFFFF